MSNKRAYYYIKLYTNYLSNAKFIKLSNETKWIYIGLYLLAQECDKGGLLIQDDNVLTEEDISVLLYTNEDVIKKSIESLKEFGFLTMCNDSFAISEKYFLEEQGPTGFGERAELNRKKWAEEKRRYRNKQ